MSIFIMFFFFFRNIHTNTWTKSLQKYSRATLNLVHVQIYENHVD